MSGCNDELLWLYAFGRHQIIFTTAPPPHHFHHDIERYELLDTVFDGCKLIFYIASSVGRYMC